MIRIYLTLFTKKNKLYSIVLIMVLCPVFSFSNKINDSIKDYLVHLPNDTSKIKTLNDLSRTAWQTGEYIHSKEYASEALELSATLKFSSGLAGAYNNLGGTYWGLGNYPEAIKYYYKQLNVGTETNDKKTIARSYHGIGLILNEQGKFSESLVNYNRALAIYSETNNEKGIAAIYNNIGGVYTQQGNLQAALDIYTKALKIRTEIKDEYGIAGCYNNFGTIYLEQGRNNLSKGNIDGASVAFTKALENFNISLKMKEVLNDKQGISTSCTNISEIMIQLKKFQEAEKYIKKSINISKEIGNIEGLRSSYESYVHLDLAKNNFTDALGHSKKYNLYNDSLKNEQNSQKFFQAQMQFEFNQKEAEQIAEQQKKDAIIAKEKYYQQIIFMLVLFVMALLVLFIILLLKNFKQLQKINAEVANQTSIIEEKQKEILDSIRYAKRLQLCLLPTESYIHKHLRKFGIKNS